MAARLTGEELDCLTFFSPSAFRFFLDVLPQPAIPKVRSSKAPIAVIGPTTAEAVKHAGLEVAIQPEKSTSEGLISAMTTYFELSRIGD
jgi:uroporphyrinogen-III synthase